MLTAISPLTNISLSFTQPSNALLPSFFNPDGKVILSREEQPLKAPSARLSPSQSPVNTISFKDVQFSKAPLYIVFTLAGKTIFSRLVQPLNVSFPITLTFEPVAK